MSNAALSATSGRPSATAMISGSRSANRGSPRTIAGVMPWSSMMNGWKAS